MSTVAGIFQSRANAERAVANLRSAGIANDYINFLTPGTTDEKVEASVPTTETEQPGMGSAMGGAVGGAMGAGCEPDIVQSKRCGGGRPACVPQRGGLGFLSHGLYIPPRGIFFKRTGDGGYGTSRSRCGRSRDRSGVRHVGRCAHRQAPTHA